MSKDFFIDYEIVFLKSARKQLEKLSKNIIGEIIEKIKIIKTHYESLDIKKLKGYQHLYRLRCGDYRIVYRILIDTKVIQIGLIAHRSEVYDSEGALHNFDG